MSYSRSLLFVCSLSICTLLSCSDDNGLVDPSFPQQPVTFHRLTVEPGVFDTDTISVTPGADKSPEDPVTLRLSVVVSPSSRFGISITNVTCHVRVEGNSDDVVAVPLTGSPS